MREYFSFILAMKIIHLKVIETEKRSMVSQEFGVVFRKGGHDEKVQHLLREEYLFERVSHRGEGGQERKRKRAGERERDPCTWANFHCFPASWQ